MSCSNCAFKCVFLANIVAQILHLNCFFPSWTNATCLLIYPFCAKLASQISQLRGLFFMNWYYFKKQRKLFDKKKNAIWVKCWSFMFLCYMLIQPWNLKLFQKTNDLEKLLFYQRNWRFSWTEGNTNENLPFSKINKMRA